MLTYSKQSPVMTAHEITSALKRMRAKSKGTQSSDIFTSGVTKSPSDRITILLFELNKSPLVTSDIDYTCLTRLILLNMT